MIMLYNKYPQSLSDSTETENKEQWKELALDTTRDPPLEMIKQKWPLIQKRIEGMRL